MYGLVCLSDCLCVLPFETANVLIAVSPAVIT